MGGGSKSLFIFFLFPFFGTYLLHLFLIPHFIIPTIVPTISCQRTTTPRLSSSLQFFFVFNYFSTGTLATGQGQRKEQTRKQVTKRTCTRSRKMYIEWKRQPAGTLPRICRQIHTNLCPRGEQEVTRSRKQNWDGGRTISFYLGRAEFCLYRRCHAWRGFLSFLPFQLLFWVQTGLIPTPSFLH